MDKPDPSPTLSRAQLKEAYPLRVRILKIEPYREAPDVVRDGRANLTEADGNVHGIDFEFEGDAEALRAISIPRTFKARSLDSHRLALFRSYVTDADISEFAIRYVVVGVVYVRAGNYFETKALGSMSGEIE